MINLKVTFELDGTGVYLTPSEPIHIDSLMLWTLVKIKGGTEIDGSRDAPVDNITLPFNTATINGATVWKASALFPDEEAQETLRYWRKKFRTDAADISEGSPNTQNGKYKEWNMPYTLTLAKTLTGWCQAYDRRSVYRMLRRIRHIGKKTAYGFGRVCGLTVEECGEDWALERNGTAMRYYPHPLGWKLVRPMPPYWNTNGRVLCLAPGDTLEIN